MDWTEALMLTRELLRETDSHVAVAVNGWRWPWSGTAFILADLFDAYVTTHSKRRPKPRPRPTDRDDEPSEVRRTRSPIVSQRRVRAELARRGHVRDEGDHG